MVTTTRSAAFRISLCYLVFSSLWILLSDRIVMLFASDHLTISLLQSTKGWLFVATTAAILYRMIAKHTDSLQTSELELQKKNEELTCAYEELLATEEELKIRFDELIAREAKITRRNECLSSLHHAALILMQEQTVDELLEAMVTKMMKMFDAQFGYIYLLDENLDAMVPRVVEGFPLNQVNPAVSRDEGIIGRVWDSGKIVVVSNYHQWSYRLQAPIYEKLRTGVGIPLKSGGQVIGVFSLNYTNEHIVDEEELQLLESLAELASLALANTSLTEALQYASYHDQVTGLYNRVYFEEKLTYLDTNGDASACIVVCDIDGLKLVNDTLGHQAGDQLLAHAARIIQAHFPSEDIVARVGGDEFAVIIPCADSTHIEHICHKIRKQVDDLCEEKISIPVSISIGVSFRTSLTQSMREVFKAADDNMYREKLHSTHSARSAIVHTLAKALEARDFVTDGHADRLQNLIIDLALAAGVPERALPDLRLFARFHDIGKVGIPDHILFKPGRLDSDEFEIMKRHCEIGYRIAQASAELIPIADWILKHQEWWNGKGYPLGLEQEAIPLPCRILAIVDAYDAMTNDRPYRKALSHQDAVAELDRFAGIQFDPQLVPKFKQLLEKKHDGH